MTTTREQRYAESPAVSPSPPETAADWELENEDIAPLCGALLDDANRLRARGEHQAADEAMALLGLTATYCHHLPDIPRVVALWRRSAKALEDWYQDAHRCAVVQPEDMP